MKIEEFAVSRRFRVRRDGCGNPIIPGKGSSHVYEGFDSGAIAVCLMFATARKWNTVRSALERAGCKVKQNGDTEGCALFDPSNDEQVSAVIKAARIKKRRIPSPAQLEHLRTMRKAA